MHEATAQPKKLLILLYSVVFLFPQKKWVLFRLYLSGKMGAVLGSAPDCHPGKTCGMQLQKIAMLGTMRTVE